MEKISIVIPVYNVEKYLERCMQSVLNQTHKNLEIILVDDGSKDGSGTMCDEYAKMDGRVRVIHKENGGLSSARNAGIKIATGQYIGFVDSDDWIALDMYENLAKLLETYECDIAVCGIQRIDNEADAITENFDLDNVILYTSKEYQQKILKVKTQDSNHYAWNKLYRKKIFCNIKYPEGLIDEDVEGTFLAVINAEKIVESKSVQYYYWINPNSITTQKFDRSQMDFLEICDHVVKISKEKCDEEIQLYAEIFRYRADLALLCRMAISEIDETYEEQSEQDAKKMVDNIRIHKKQLKNADIPISRKILLRMFCLNYKLTFRVIRIVKDGINKKRKRMT